MPRYLVCRTEEVNYFTEVKANDEAGALHLAKGLTAVDPHELWKCTDNGPTKYTITNLTDEQHSLEHYNALQNQGEI